MPKRFLRAYIMESTQTDVSGSLNVNRTVNTRTTVDLSNNTLLVKRRPGRSFYASDIPTIYTFPRPTSRRVVIGVVSLGGTITGNIDPNGILTNGDVQAYWASLGITNMPVVKVVRINGSALDPTDITATIENTIDVSMVGACCPTSNLTIVLYYYNQYTAPIGVDAFYQVFTEAINRTVSVPVLGSVRPSIISCSWGAPENQFSSAELTKYDTLFRSAQALGVTITAASGDLGSSNGTSGTITDFPSSSPNVVSCGGTTLICSNQDVSGNYIYLGSTETTWSWSVSNRAGTGGGISSFFSGPPYPKVNLNKRQTPDLALVADPNTGVAFSINGLLRVIGGTSIVSPAIAGLVACLPATNKSFLLKMYALPSNAFNDITVGTNEAYFAGPGYDNCTGLGSINGSVLIPAYNALLASPPITNVRIGGVLTAMTDSTSQLTATVANVWWVSSNPLIATVSNTGLVKGISQGSVTIFVITKNNFIRTTATFVVTPLRFPSLRISKSLNGPILRSVTIRRGSFLTVYAVAMFTTSPIVWSTSNTNFATVNNGLIRIGSRVGTVIITASSPPLFASLIIYVI